MRITNVPRDDGRGMPGKAAGGSLDRRRFLAAGGAAAALLDARVSHFREPPSVAGFKVTAARGTVTAEIPLAGHASEHWLELFAR